MNFIVTDLAEIKALHEAFEAYRIPDYKHHLYGGVCYAMYGQAGFPELAGYARIKCLQTSDDQLTKLLTTATAMPEVFRILVYPFNNWHVVELHVADNALATKVIKRLQKVKP